MPESKPSRTISQKTAQKKKSGMDWSLRTVQPSPELPGELLRNSLERIVKLSGGLILALDADQIVQYVNPSCTRVLGCPQEDILGRNWIEEFVDPSVRPIILKSFQDLTSGKRETSGYFIIPLYNRQEKEFLIEWEGVVLKDSHDHIQGVLFWGRDITQQKMIEKELIQSEWDMALAQKIARLGSWVYNVNKNEFRLSDEMYRILGIDPKKFKGTYNAFLKLIHPEDRPRVDESHKDSSNSGKDHSLEYRVLNDEGLVRIFHEETKVFLDDEDQPLKIRGIVQDITLRKKVEEALTHSERELSIAQKIGKMGNWIYDIEIDGWWGSEEFYRIFGLDQNEFGGSYKAFLNTVHPEDRELVDRTIQKALGGKKAYNMDHRIVRPDGSVRTVYQECKIYYREKGKPEKIRGILQDITERKQAEEKLKTFQEQLMHSEKLSSIGKLSASIAHEINNPLFGIRNVLERMKITVKLTETDERFIDMAISETDRIAKLTQKLNKFFGPAPENKENVNLNHILEEIILLIQKELNDRKIDLNIDYCDSLPELKVVPDQIKQVALNLLQNAMEALPETGGKITLSTQEDGLHVYFSVKDNGAGLSPESRKSIFESFFTTKSKSGGTGLGLWVTHTIVQSHGGEIKVESEENKGSTFTVSLPVIKD